MVYHLAARMVYGLEKRVMQRIWAQKLYSTEHRRSRKDLLQTFRFMEGPTGAQSNDHLVIFHK